MRCPHCGVIEPEWRTTGVKGLNLMPPAKDVCQVCAHAHDPAEPHNAQSIYYQTAFNMIRGRGVTWADALAHCGVDLQQKWRAELELRGVWTEPPEGTAPVQHLGLDAAECNCWRCIGERHDTEAMQHFVVCAVCGNKRCPKADDHRHLCTNSNEPGQKARLA